MNLFPVFPLFLLTLVTLHSPPSHLVQAVKCLQCGGTVDEGQESCVPEPNGRIEPDCPNGCSTTRITEASTQLDGFVFKACLSSPNKFDLIQCVQQKMSQNGSCVHGGASTLEEHYHKCVEALLPPSPTGNETTEAPTATSAPLSLSLFDYGSTTKSRKFGRNDQDEEYGLYCLCSDEMCNEKDLRPPEVVAVDQEAMAKSRSKRFAREGNGNQTSGPGSRRERARYNRMVVLMAMGIMLTAWIRSRN